HDKQTRIATWCRIHWNGRGDCQILLFLWLQSELRRCELEKRARNPAASTAEQIGGCGHEAHDMALVVTQRHRDGGTLAPSHGSCWAQLGKWIRGARHRFRRAVWLCGHILQAWPDGRYFVYEIVHLT